MHNNAPTLLQYLKQCPLAELQTSPNAGFRVILG